MIVGIVVVLMAILLYAVFQKKDHEEVKLQPDDVDGANNLIANYSFERIIDPDNDWSVNAELPYANFGYDNFTKYDSAASFVLVSDAEDQPPIFLLQKIKSIKPDRKLNLFGFVRTEDCDSARLELELHDKNSLIIKVFSDCAKGTTDWTEYNAWIKTFLPDNVVEGDLYVIVKCVVYNRGRAWFDEIRLYSPP